MLKNFRIILALAFLPLTLAGCQGDIIDCQDICTDVEDCIGDQFDVADCRGSCREQSHNAINECDACLDDTPDSCGQCLAECAPLGLMIIASE